MASVTQRIPHYLGGVSKQSDVKKFPGQVRECINAYPEPTFGLIKRPGFEFLHSLDQTTGGTDFSGTALDNAKWFYINRDDDETYIGCVISEAIHIWNGKANESGEYVKATITYTDTTFTITDSGAANSGNNGTYEDVSVTGGSGSGMKVTATVSGGEVTVLAATTEGTGYKIGDTITIAKGDVGNTLRDPTAEITAISSKAYLDTTRDNYDVLTVQDTTYITNKTKVTTVKPAPTTNSLSKKGTIRIRGVDYSSEFSVTITETGGSDQTYTFTTRDVDNFTGESDPGSVKLSTDVILDALETGINALSLDSSFTVTKLKATLELSSDVAFTMTCKGGPGNELLTCFQDQVEDLSKLPEESVDGRHVKIINTKSDQDTYYAKFVAESGSSGSGHWEETVAQDVSKGFHANTMPHELFNDDTNVFTFKPITWSERLVGDDETNEHPSFKDNTIQQVFFHNNRLGFLTSDNVSMSQSGQFKNFYHESARALTAADPVDLNCSAVRPAVLHGVLPTTQGLILFSEKSQYIMYSDNGVLTPRTTVIRGISNYEIDNKIAPIDNGTTLAFLSKTPGYSRVFSMETQGQENNPNILDIAKTVAEYIPDTITSMVASPQNELIALYGESMSDVYFYRTYHDGKELVLQAWFKWTFPGNVLHINVDNDSMWAVVKAVNSDSTKNRYHLIKTSLTQTPENPILTTNDGHSINPYMDMYATATNGKLTDIVTFTHDAATETARTPGTYTPAAHAKGASFQVVVADAGSGVGGAVTITLTAGGRGYAVGDEITLLAADTGWSGGDDIKITVASISEKKVVYDSTGDYSKCYIPYVDIPNATPVLILKGDASAGELAGYTLSPERDSDSDGDFFKVAEKDWTATGENLVDKVVVGYKYAYDVTLPKTYYQMAENTYDYTSILTIARMKFSVGLSSVVGFKVKRRGRNTPYHEWTGVGTTFSSTLVADGTGAGPEGDHTVKDVETTTSGSGTGMTVDVTMSDGKATAVTVNTEGTGYANSDTITIAKGDIGDTTDDVTATIAKVGQTAFPFNFDYTDVNDLKVKVNGVETTAYTIADKVLTMTSIPPDGHKVLLYTDTWYDIQTVKDANEYLADDVPLAEQSLFTLPIHDKTDNFSVRVFSDSPFPISLTSMMWEGNYSPRYYRRT